MRSDWLIICWAANSDKPTNRGTSTIAVFPLTGMGVARGTGRAGARCFDPGRDKPDWLEEASAGVAVASESDELALPDGLQSPTCCNPTALVGAATSTGTSTEKPDASVPSSTTISSLVALPSDKTSGFASPRSVVRFWSIAAPFPP